MSFRELFAHEFVPPDIRDMLEDVEGGLAFKSVSFSTSEIAWAYFYCVRVVRPSLDLLYSATEALCDCLELPTDSNRVIDEDRASFDALWLNEPCVVEAQVMKDIRLVKTFKRLFTLLRMPGLATTIRKRDFIKLGEVHPAMYELQENCDEQAQDYDEDDEDGGRESEDEKAADVGIEVQ